jgi:hypothetical protein
VIFVEWNNNCVLVGTDFGMTETVVAVSSWNRATYQKEWYITTKATVLR